MLPYPDAREAATVTVLAQVVVQTAGSISTCQLGGFRRASGSVSAPVPSSRLRCVKCSAKIGVAFVWKVLSRAGAPGSGCAAAALSAFPLPPSPAAAPSCKFQYRTVASAPPADSHDDMWFLLTCFTFASQGAAIWQCMFTLVVRMGCLGAEAPWFESWRQIALRGKAALKRS